MPSCCWDMLRFTPRNVTESYFFIWNQSTIHSQYLWIDEFYSIKQEMETRLWHMRRKCWPTLLHLGMKPWHDLMLTRILSGGVSTRNVQGINHKIAWNYILKHTTTSPWVLKELWFDLSIWIGMYYWNYSKKYHADLMQNSIMHRWVILSRAMIHLIIKSKPSTKVKFPLAMRAICSSITGIISKHYN